MTMYVKLLETNSITRGSMRNDGRFHMLVAYTLPGCAMKLVLLIIVPTMANTTTQPGTFLPARKKSSVVFWLREK